MGKKLVPLTQTEAIQRFENIGQDIKYRYFYDFKGGDSYEGLAELNFEYKAGNDIWIDW